MIVKAKTLSWYHDQKEFEQGKKPLGVIYMHAIYHCVPAKGLRQTDDLNVSILANENRSVQAPGGRKTPRRKAGESSRLVLRTSSRETNGSLASNTFELKQSMIISCQSIATQLSLYVEGRRNELEKRKLIYLINSSNSVTNLKAKREQLAEDVMTIQCIQVKEELIKKGQQPERALHHRTFR